MESILVEIFIIKINFKALLLYYSSHSMVHKLSDPEDHFCDEVDL